MTMGDAMRITPLDIQQMVFKVSFRGYDKEEVNRFLEELAQTVESLNRDNAVQREKIIFLEQQLTELKRTEATLSSTLQSAQSLAMRDGPERGLDLLDELAHDPRLLSHHLFHASRAELLHRSGRVVEAIAAYGRALAMPQNDSERRYLERRLAQAKNVDPGAGIGG